MAQVFPRHILGRGVGAHIDAAHVFADEPQHDEDHTAQQKQQRRGGRPADGRGMAHKMVDNDKNQVEEPGQRRQRAEVGGGLTEKDVKPFIHRLSSLPSV